MKMVHVGPGQSAHPVAWLRESAARGHVSMFVGYPPLTADHSDAVSAEALAGRGPSGRWTALREVLRRERPDVVCHHYANIDLLPLSLLGSPLVASVWGSDILRDLEGRGIKRAIVYAGLRRAALVVSPAEHMTQRLQAAGVSPDRIITAQYGVDTETFTPPDGGITDGPARVVSTRAFAPVYRIDDLIAATAYLEPSNVGEVRLVGDGPLEPALREQVDRADAAVPVEFSGRVDHDDLPAVLRDSDVYVSTSESDGTSLSLLEAMATGLTPVVTDIPANREWIEDGVDGLLVPVGDPGALATAISRASTDRDLRERALESGREKVVSRGDQSRNIARIIDAVERVARA